MRRLFNYFSGFEKALWLAAVALNIVSYFLSESKDPLATIASIFGVSSLICNAKGNPAGQVFMMIFCVMYGFIAHQNQYYGEMFTYLGMSLPMAVFSFVTWMRNPFSGKRTEVRINRISGREAFVLAVLDVVVTIAFYFILAAFHTDHLILSTLSVATCFAAAYLSARRDRLRSIGYASNDVVLIIMWSLKALDGSSNWSVTICFAMMMLCDLYAFVNWQRIERRQQAVAEADGAGVVNTRK